MEAKEDKESCSDSSRVPASVRASLRASLRRCLLGACVVLRGNVCACACVGACMSVYVM